ncbi:MAG: isopentenyl-diphosphate Delta-isomerase, partial [Propionibacterium sp.]|nr:isopentenyl-diphosphate Delta-isomerase [Propionibacterium sp.]
MSILDSSTRLEHDHDVVVLLDEDGSAIGTAPRAEVHTTATPLHLAFSSYLFGPDGRVLLTRRALTKRTWPGVWTNSCCGHPLPGESMEDAIRRRVRDELGASVGPLMPALPDFRYRAVDFSGIVENEICPVYVGSLSTDPVPNPDEVMDYQWVEWCELAEAIGATPGVYSPWAAMQVPQLESVLARLSTAEHQPSAAECIADVDALLTDEMQELRETWALHAGDVGVDVLELDLPDWLDDVMHAGGKRFRVTMA